MCLRPVDAGGHDGTNDLSPKVLSKTDFLQVPTQISFIFLCQGDFKVSVDCDGSKDFVNLDFFLLIVRRKRKEVFMPKLSIVMEAFIPLYKMFSVLIMQI